MALPCMVCGRWTILICSGVPCCNSCSCHFRRTCLNLLNGTLRTQQALQTCKCKPGTMCRHCKYQKCLELNMETKDLMLLRERQIEEESTSGIQNLIMDLNEKRKKDFNIFRFEGNWLTPTGLLWSTDIDSFIISDRSASSFIEWIAIDRATSINFLKHLPVFKKLTIEDQIKFLEHNARKYSLLALAMYCYESEKDELRYPNGVDIFPATTDMERAQRIRKTLVEKVKKVMPSDEEFAALTALVSYNGSLQNYTAWGDIVAAETEQKELLLKECRKKRSVLAASARIEQLYSILNCVYKCNEDLQTVILMFGIQNRVSIPF